MQFPFLQGWIDGMFAAIRFHLVVVKAAQARAVMVRCIQLGLSLDAPTMQLYARGFSEGHSRTRERLEAGAIRQEELEEVSHGH